MSDTTKTQMTIVNSSIGIMMMLHLMKELIQTIVSHNNPSIFKQTVGVLWRQLKCNCSARGRLVTSVLCPLLIGVSVGFRGVWLEAPPLRHVAVRWLVARLVIPLGDEAHVLIKLTRRGRRDKEQAEETEILLHYNYTQLMLLSNAMGLMIQGIGYSHWSNVGLGAEIALQPWIGKW